MYLTKKRRNFIRRNANPGKLWTTESSSFTSLFKEDLPTFKLMMELAHSFVLNEAAYKQIGDGNKPLFLYEWLRFLRKVLENMQKTDIKDAQKTLEQQLLGLITREMHGEAVRNLIGRNLATIFSIGDTFGLYTAVDKCNEVLKSRDDSVTTLHKVGAATCLKELYQKLGRMVGNTYSDTLPLILRLIKNSENEFKQYFFMALSEILHSLGSLSQSYYKEIIKAIKSHHNDKSLIIRSSAIQCLATLIKQPAFLNSVEIENLASIGFRAFEGSNFELRCHVADMFANLLIASLMPNQPAHPGGLKDRSSAKKLNISDALSLLSIGFAKGNSGFFKSSESTKSLFSSSQQVRVGITEAYIYFFREMGKTWTEKHLRLIITHVLDLAENPKCVATHLDAVYTRKCVNFILGFVIGQLIGEKAQVEACKELAKYINSKMSARGADVISNDGDNNSYHGIISALNELSRAFTQLGTSASHFVMDSTQNLDTMESISAVLLHPNESTRLAAAWCLRCVAIAVPHQMSLILDRCLVRVEALKSCPEAVSGYCSAVAAIVGGQHLCSLGIPTLKVKAVFGLAEDLLRTASQNTRLSLPRTQVGWLIMSSLICLGPVTVKGFLSKLLLLWRNAFPRSAKEIEAERAKFDAFTWQLSLEGRSGALSAMKCFIENCTELLSDEVIRRLMTPLECALSLLESIPTFVKGSHLHLKANAAMLRYRLYRVFILLPTSAYESSLGSLIKTLVAEFTLTDNPSHITSSLLRSFCYRDDSVVLGAWLYPTDFKLVEEQIPTPLPLGVCVIDASINLFTEVFSKIAVKHRQQIFLHFAECVKHSKSVRQYCIQVNIFTALLGALKILAENKIPLGAGLQSSAMNFIQTVIADSNPLLRCASGEAIGRLTQVLEDPAFVSTIAQCSFNNIQNQRDALSRTGNCMALGCLHRYVGGRGASAYISTSVSVLLALAKDYSNSLVQVWALHALALVCNSGGNMFRSYVEHTLDSMIDMLLVPLCQSTDVLKCIGRIVAALISTLGPELQGNSSQISSVRSSCLLACTILQNHNDYEVQVEAISVLQQLHLFAHKHIQLTTVVPFLCSNLNKPSLQIRQESLSFLKQLTQREASEVCSIASTHFSSNKTSMADVYSTDLELPSLLFSMLDKEIDAGVFKDIHDILLIIFNSQAASNLSHWLSLFRNVLFTAAGDADVPEPETTDNVEEEEEADDSDEDANVEFKGISKDQGTTLLQRSATRVFATQCLQRLFEIVEDDARHLNAVYAKSANGDYLVLHVQELVRMGFMAATASHDELQLEGLKILEEIIRTFSKVRDPDYEDQTLLEQYQAQFGAALRPVFLQESSPHILSKACEVCSLWITSSIATDLNDLRRVHQLLVSSLNKIQQHDSQTSKIFSTTSATMERLAVLKAWADMYAVSVGELGKSTGATSLLELVTPELSTLNVLWMAALKEYAVIFVPLQQQTVDEVPFGVREASWSSILYSCSLYYSKVLLEERVDSEIKTDVQFLVGVAMSSLNDPKILMNIEQTLCCLRCLSSLLRQKSSMEIVTNTKNMLVEITIVQLRVILSVSDSQAEELIMDVLNSCVSAESQNAAASSDAADDAAEEHDASSCGSLGQETTDILSENSIVRTSMEILMCVFVKHIPSMRDTLITNIRTNKQLKDSSATVLSLSGRIMNALIAYCTPKASVAVATTCLHLLTIALKDCCSKQSSLAVLNPLLLCLSNLLVCCHKDNPEVAHLYKQMFTSTFLTLLEYFDNVVDLDKLRALLVLVKVLISVPVETICHKNTVTRTEAFFLDCLSMETNGVQVLKLIMSVFRSAELASIFKESIAKKVSLLYMQMSSFTGDSERELFFAYCDLLTTLVCLTSEFQRRCQMAYCILWKFAKVCKELHEEVYCLKLTSLVKMYSEDVKMILASKPDFKDILEQGLKLQEKVNESETKSQTSKVITGPKQPTIKLKMNFSHFTGSGK